MSVLPEHQAAWEALEAIAQDDLPTAWRALAPYQAQTLTSPEVARTWILLTAQAENAWRWRHLIGEIFRAFPQDIDLLIEGCDALLDALGHRPVDAEPPLDDPAHIARQALEDSLARLPDEQRPRRLQLLGEALLGCGRAYAPQAIAALQAALAEQPGGSGLELLAQALKIAGRFGEALAALEEHPRPEHDDWLWNRAICATGAGRGDIALQCWQEKGMTDAVLGADGLPQVPDLGVLQVRVGGQVVAARPLSPCHGVLLEDAGEDLRAKDRVLWDGVPVVQVSPGEMPCMPFLARLPLQ